MRRAIFVFSASLLALTACTTTNGGTASPSKTTPSDTPSSSATEEVPGPGVPKVAHPLDIARFSRAPCDSLTADQITELLGSGVVSKPNLDAPAGPTCNWDSPNVSQAGVGVIFSNVDKLGLTSVYSARGTKYPFFKPLDPVDGYPLVAYDGEGDQSAKGQCTVAMGTSDTQTVDINVAQSETNIGKKDPCAAVREVAGKVLENLRKGN